MLVAARYSGLEDVCGKEDCSASGRTRALSSCKGILLDYILHIAMPNSVGFLLLPDLV